jgi:hypothetical protein
MPSRVAALKPLLTEKIKKRRMAFCNKYKSWTETDWSTVMYSDESMFCCIRATRSRVRRPIGSNHYESRFTGHDLGVFFFIWGTWGPVFPPKEHHHEGRELRDGAQGPPLTIHGYPPVDTLPPGWSAVSQQQRIKDFLSEQNF